MLLEVIKIKKNAIDLVMLATKLFQLEDQIDVVMYKLEE